MLLSSLFDTKASIIRLAHKHLTVHDQKWWYFSHRRSWQYLVHPLLIVYAKSTEDKICTGFILTMWFLNSKKYKTVFTLYFLFEIQTSDHGYRSWSDIHFVLGIRLSGQNYSRMSLEKLKHWQKSEISCRICVSLVQLV